MSIACAKRVSLVQMNWALPSSRHKLFVRKRLDLRLTCGVRSSYITFSPGGRVPGSNQRWTIATMRDAAKIAFGAVKWSLRMRILRCRPTTRLLDHTEELFPALSGFAGKVLVSRPRRQNCVQETLQAKYSSLCGCFISFDPIPPYSSTGAE